MSDKELQKHVLPPNITNGHGEPETIETLRKHAQEGIEGAQHRIRQFLSRVCAYRWIKAVKETQADKEDFAKVLAEYRGLSADVFAWLIDLGEIALVSSDRTNKSGEHFETIDIAFPVIKRGAFIGEELVGWKEWSYPSSTNPDYARIHFENPWVFERDMVFIGGPDEFLGMHLKWGWYSQKSGWAYDPKGRGTQPWIVGDLSKADLVIIAESTWDPIAFVDCYDLYKSNRAFVIIATRGASNNSLPASEIKPDATILLIRQNDTANEVWQSNLPVDIQERGRRIFPPESIKDFNDWMKFVTKEQIRKELGN
jgi:hypothetical protein